MLWCCVTVGKTDEKGLCCGGCGVVVGLVSGCGGCCIADETDEKKVVVLWCCIIVDETDGKRLCCGGSGE